MGIRDRLHSLVDELPDSELETAQRLLIPLKQAKADSLDQLLREAPIDDEPVIPEDERRLAEVRESFRRGETISSEEIKRTLLN